MKYSPTLCFACFNSKRDKSLRKRRKNGQARNLYREKVLFYCDRITKEPAKLCRNQQLYVVTKSKLNSRKDFYHDKVFLCRDIAEAECEEDYRDTLDYVPTLIKANDSGTLLRQSLFSRNIKE